MQRIDNSRTGSKFVSVDLSWMDMSRGVAVLGIVIHHWLLFNTHESSTAIFSNLAELIQSVGGTTVHLFFILSGCGLTLSYYKNRSSSWRQWAYRRFRRIFFPYCVIVLLTFLLANLSSIVFPAVVKTGYSGFVLLAYVTFMRNFYSPGWGMNPTLWFMPVIAGLYVLFPILVMLLKKYGISVFITLSAIITYASITLCIFLGYPVTHQTALPLFYLAEFSLGMLVGYGMYAHAQWLNRAANFKVFSIGLLLYVLSWAVQKQWTLGNAFNDLLTGVGVFAMTLYACDVIRRFSWKRLVEMLRQVSKHSYLMYLIHGPLILFVVKPLLAHATEAPIDSRIMIVLGCVYCAVVFLLAKGISPFFNLPASRPVPLAKPGSNL